MDYGINSVMLKRMCLNRKICLVRWINTTHFFTPVCSLTRFKGVFDPNVVIII